MLRCTGSAAVVVVVLLAASTQGVPEQQAASPAGKAPLSLGPTYDEIVVETQLAVRPKVSGQGAGLSLRSGRAKAPKAVFFRPNVTASGRASGAEVRHITPLAASSTTPSDGISFAARVVSEENPLAVERARKAAAAAARARRESSMSSFTSSSHSFRSSSSSSEHSGPPSPAGVTSAAPAPAAAPGTTSSTTSSSHSSGSSSHTYTRQLADGRTVTVTETDEFQASLGPDTKGPTASRLHTVLIGGL